jgi:serine/threonine-protein kinase
VVKVLDFGLAKLDPMAGDDLSNAPTAAWGMTREGALVGTVPYMSPEQLEAKTVDPRSDIFSLGIVLHQMATGRLPFGGGSTAALISAILTRTPERVDQVRELPPRLGELIERCLQKDREERPRTAKEVLVELESLRNALTAGTLERAAPSQGARSIRASGDRRFPAPWWRSSWRSLSWRWATALGVGVLAVVVGAVFWGSGDEGDEPSGDAATRSGGIAEAALPGDPYRATVEAGELLRHYYREGNVDRAIRLLEHALALDANSPFAHATLAQAFVWKQLADPDALWLPRAMEAADRAVELADSVAVGHLARGVVLRERGETAEALEELRRAVELDPRSVPARRELAVALAAAGEVEPARDAFERAIELEPSDWLTFQRRGQAEYRRTDFDAAEESFRKAIDLAPDYVSAYRNLAAVHHMQGRYEEAAGELQRSLEIEPNDRAYSNLGTLQFFLGRYAAAVESFENAVRLGANNHLYWGNLGDAYRWAPGQRAKADAAYRRALELGREQLTVRSDDAELQAELALFLVKSGQSDEAVAEIERALQLAPDDPWVLASAAVVLEIAGRRERALDALADAIEAGYSVDELKRDPELLELRKDPAYHRLVLDR